MSAKIILMLALAVVAVSTVTAQYYDAYNPLPYYGGYGYGYGYVDEEGPINNDIDATVISTGSQEATNTYSKASSNKNLATNVNSKSDLSKDQTAQKEKVPLDDYEN